MDWRPTVTVKRVLWPKPINLASLVAILTSSRGGVWAGTMAKDQAAEAQAFRAVYYAAVSPWRDADAAMRKAFQD
jgi:hypothetical protein